MLSHLISGSKSCNIMLSTVWFYAGILVFAKTAMAAKWTAHAFADRRVDKKYMCVVNNNSDDTSSNADQTDDTSTKQRKDPFKSFQVLNSDGNCHHLIQKTPESRVNVVSVDAVNDPKSGVKAVPIQHSRRQYPRTNQRRSNARRDDIDAEEGGDDDEDSSDESELQVVSVGGHEMHMLPAKLSYHLIATVVKPPPATRTKDDPKKPGTGSVKDAIKKRVSMSSTEGMHLQCSFTPDNM
jgi:hypothetical protein